MAELWGSRPSPSQERRRIDALVHVVLLVGGGAAGVLLCGAILVSFIERRGLPKQADGFAEIVRSLAHLQPAGLASLGLVLLILTPVARVVGSIVAFVVAKDLRYVLITSLVLSLMIASLLLGQG
ncbi:MAG: DUF1634 domain-containing protein [Polyangia bacterium]